MKFRAVFLDIDDTLFDFRKSSFEALVTAFAELGVPFTEADSLALSQLAYARMPDNVPRYHENAETADGMIATVPIHDLLRAECYDDMFGKVWSPSMNVDLLRAMSESPRWRNLRVGAYVDEFDAETTKQFSACVFELGNGTLYVAFRGTDSSIVGWKEDFMMAFRRPVASQEAAARYLTELAGHWAGPIMVGGHSKGGNLAVYAAMNAEDDVKDRIERIYSLDGPGFPEAVVNSFEYASVSDRIVKIVPDSSVVGMVLETPERCIVVKSDVEGIMQHFVFSWQMHGGEFDKVEDVASSSVTFNKALNKWLANLSKEQRERAVDALFAVLEASGAGSISAMMAAGPKVIPEMLGTYVGLSGEDRRNLNQALAIMLQAALARNPKVRRR